MRWRGPTDVSEFDRYQVRLNKMIAAYYDCDGWGDNDNGVDNDNDNDNDNHYASEFDR